MGYSYRTSGPWGVGLGRNLHPAEVDANFWQAVQDIAAKAVQGVGISNIVVMGNQMTVVLTDHTLLGPYTLPMMQIKFGGEWVPNTYYAAGTIITHGGSTYFVNVNHTSAATFDPGANGGGPPDYYGLLLENPALNIPDTGPLGSFLRIIGTSPTTTWGWRSAALDDLSDVSIIASPGPATGQVLTFDGIVWSAADIPTGTTALSDLTDVSVLASPVPTTGAVLTWTGSSWDAEVHSAATLAGLDDVALTGPANGQGLFYNSATSKWNNLNAFDPPVRTLSSTSGTVTVDLSGSAYTKVTFIGNTVISGFTWPSGASGQFLHRMLSIQNSGAYTVSWPTIKWAGGAVPTVTPNGTDMFVLHTIDGGTTVYGNVIGQNYS